jgi:hypothetical protein
VTASRRYDPFVRRILAIVIVGLACGDDTTAEPAPIGPGSAASSPGPVTRVSSGDETSSDGSGDGTSSSSGASSSSSDTDPQIETGSDTSCGTWAEVYLGCIDTMSTIADLEMQCEAELTDYEEPLPSCRVLAEELLVCVTQVPCQAFADWEINRAVPAECAPDLEALETMCSLFGTGTG